MRSSNAGQQSGGRPGGGPARALPHSAASAAKSGASPSSGGRLKAGPSAPTLKVKEEISPAFYKDERKLMKCCRYAEAMGTPGVR